MFRYLVFAGANYYPSGPEDFQQAFKTIEEAREHANQCREKKPNSNFPKNDWADIVEFDPTTGEFKVVEWVRP